MIPPNYSKKSSIAEKSNTTIDNKIDTVKNQEINFQSHALLQTYSAILPTSLTSVNLIDQRLLTLETCCGYWYDQVRK